ncbi:MAG: AraC family transcriptional regulator, partial [Lachnoclostridium sp.]|nr:AraC family transcriptional regulator [Lachnoclostridium sp.]
MSQHYSIIEFKHPVANDFYYTAEHKINSNYSKVSYHSHDFFEIYVYLSGNIQFWIKDTLFNFKKGDVLIIPPYYMHSMIPFGNDETYDRIYIHATQRVLSSLQINHHSLSKPLEDAINTGRLLYAISDIRDFEEVIRVVDYMQTQKSINNPNKELIRQSCIMYIVSIISKYFQHEAEGENKQETDILFAKTTAYINKNYTKNISISDLCKEMLTNRQKLYTLFKKYTNLTMHEYIVSLRITRSMQLIADGNKPSKIYKQCGFDDYSTFYRAFKKVSNQTPNEFNVSIAWKAATSNPSEVIEKSGKEIFSSVDSSLTADEKSK